MATGDFIDYYEILEISPNANPETVERMFRYFAQRYHPDNVATADRARFDTVVEAHQILRDPIKRASYDLARANQSTMRAKLVDEVGDATSIELGLDVQNKVLSLLYVKCRQNVRDPGIGDSELERLTGCPVEHLEFHLWYLKEKSWIRRIENGQFAITVGGVDRVNSGHQRETAGNLLTDGTKKP